VVVENGVLQICLLLVQLLLAAAEEIAAAEMVEVQMVDVLLVAQLGGLFAFHRAAPSIVLMTVQMVDVLLVAHLGGLLAFHSAAPSIVSMTVLVQTEKESVKCQVLVICQVHCKALLLAYLMVDQATLERDGVALEAEVADNLLLVAAASVVS